MLLTFCVSSVLFARGALSGGYTTDECIADEDCTRSVLSRIQTRMGDLIVWENFLDPQGMELTGNDTTVYGMAYLDLANNGPMVIEVDPSPFLGSINLYFGPSAPEGFENSWVETIPGRGGWVWFRFYSPGEAFFDKSWQLPDLERME